MRKCENIYRVHINRTLARRERRRLMRCEGANSRWEEDKVRVGAGGEEIIN